MVVNIGSCTQFYTLYRFATFSSMCMSETWLFVPRFLHTHIQTVGRALRPHHFSFFVFVTMWWPHGTGWHPPLAYIANHYAAFDVILNELSNPIAAVCLTPSIWYLFAYYLWVINNHVISLNKLTFYNCYQYWTAYHLVPLNNARLSSSQKPKSPLIPVCSG